MKEVDNQIKDLHPGDLVKIEWFDASVGKSLSGGLAGIDVPVKSWGIYLGLLGQKNKHIILAQNNFQYADGLYDIDYTAIPKSWTSNIQVIQESHVPADEAEQLLSSFLKGGRKTLNERIHQKRVINHDRLA